MTDLLSLTANCKLGMHETEMNCNFYQNQSDGLLLQALSPGQADD